MGKIRKVLERRLVQVVHLEGLDRCQTADEGRDSEGLVGLPDLLLDDSHASQQRAFDDERRKYGQVRDGSKITQNDLPDSRS